VDDLQDATAVLDLERREAAIMFIDLRDFTAYAEIAPASEMVGVLAEYRRIIAGAVLSFNGTVDKVIGDGVMILQDVELARESGFLNHRAHMLSLTSFWPVGNAPSGRFAR
jgi:class 3 adenylate cyclase